MLTSEQANVVADALIDGARQQTLDLRNAQARRVPFYLATPALRSLESWRQAELLRQATHNVRSSAILVGPTLGWCALCLLLWIAVGKPFTSASFGIASILLIAPTVWWRYWLVRRELRRLASEAVIQGNVAPEV